MLHTLHVTKEDYVGASYISNVDCPIARALKREFPQFADYIIVGGDGFSVNGRKIRLPESALEAIKPFQHGGEGVPFSFEVEVPGY